MPLPESNLVMYVAGGGSGGGSSRAPVVVDALPEIGRYGVTYLVPNGGTPPNVYDEYIWVSAEAGYELLGQKEVDLSHYVRDTRTVNGHPLSANVVVAYADLQDKPSIEGMTLAGNKTAADLGLVPDTRKVGNVPLSADIPVSLTGDTAITVTNTGTASAIGYSVAHNDSGVTAGGKGDTTNQTPGFGGTFKALSATVDAKGHVTALGDHTVKVPSDTATTSKDGLMSKGDKAKLDAYASKGSTAKGVYIDASGVPQTMAHELNADVPANFAPAAAAPLMDGTAAVGESAKYAREDHVHPTDTSRASATDVAALQNENTLLREYLKSMEVYRVASGNPATFRDGYAANVRDLSVTITSTQSGSGDPYPPGGGKNLLDFNAYCSLNSVTSNGITFTVVRNPDGSLAYVEANGTSTGRSQLQLDNIPPSVHHGFAGMIVSGLVRPDNLSDTTSQIRIESASYPRTFYASDTGNGYTIGSNIANETDDIILMLIATLNPGTTISGMRFYPMIRRPETDAAYAPYSNIRPITGVNSVSVTRTGKNLLEIVESSVTKNGLTFTVDHDAGTVTVNGTATAVTGFSFNSNIPMKAGVYIVSCETVNGPSNYKDAYAQYNSGNYWADEVGGSVTQTITRPAETGRCIMYVKSGVTLNNAVFRPMIRFASESDADFEPYRGRQSVSVSLVDSNDAPLTVYGGTLNVTTGVLTVTKTSTSISGGLTRYSSDDTATHYCYYTTAIDDSALAWGNSQLISDKAIVGRGTTSDAVTVYITNGSARGMFYFRKDFLADDSATTVNTWLAENPVQIVYPLATPVTYQLTPAQIATLAGYNAVFSDAGPVDVTYRADPSITLGG